MKTLSTIFVFIMISALTSVSNGQTKWEKDPSNPVMVADEPWCINLGPVCVIFDDTTYHLWYSGHDGTHARIGYATSPDGKTWTPYTSNPVLDVGVTGKWDSLWVGNPYVIYDGITYHMWYQGWNGTNHRIGYATSTDKITWTRYAMNPVMSESLVGSWDDRGVGNPCIYFDGSIFHMWYYGWNVQSVGRIGYATSADGITWTKYDSNPVLNVGSMGSWDSLTVLAPDVIFDGAKYHMWYNGESAEWESRIGYATSDNGTTQTKFAGNPVLDVGVSGEWDSKWAGFSRVLFNKADSLYKMWYGGGTQDWIGSMGYATAPDSVSGIYEVISTVLPSNFVLMQNYPNPFNPSTAIGYQLPAVSNVELSIYNMLGQKVAILVNSRQTAGHYQVQWNASRMASGVYYYQLKTEQFEDVKKMVLIR